MTKPYTTDEIRRIKDGDWPWDFNPEALVQTVEHLFDILDQFTCCWDDLYDVRGDND